MRRWVGFALAILAGVALGLLYGWVVNPVKYVDTTPGSLKADYQTDYILMIAEVYHTNADLDWAAQQLAILGSASPVQIVQQAILNAQKLGYSQPDLQRMSALALALQTHSGGGR